MINVYGVVRGALLLMLLVISLHSYGNNDELLTSWNNTKTKNDIVAFVSDVTNPSIDSFVPENKRIAVFDLDGTIFVERPFYTEVLTSIRILNKKLKNDPSLASIEPYKSVIRNDVDYIERNGGLIVRVAGEGLTIEEVHLNAREYMIDTTHKKLNKKYKDLFYSPMLGLIQYLMANKFTVFVVSTSQQEFIRSYSNECIKLPKLNIIGSMMSFSSINTNSGINFKLSGKWWEPENGDVGKVLRIKERTGYLPIFAAGNSSGDKDMMLATSANSGFVMLIDHDDPEREYKYIKQSMIELAKKEGWNIVSMKNDFAKIFKSECEL